MSNVVKRQVVKVTSSGQINPSIHYHLWIMTHILYVTSYAKNKTDLDKYLSLNRQEETDKSDNQASKQEQQVGTK